MNPAQRIDRLRANLIEMRRYVRVSPDAVQGSIDATVLELEVLKAELDQPARVAEFDALMSEAPAEPNPSIFADPPVRPWTTRNHLCCYRVGCWREATRVVRHDNGATSYQCDEHAPAGSEPCEPFADGETGEDDLGEDDPDTTSRKPLGPFSLFLLIAATVCGILAAYCLFVIHNPLPGGRP